MLSIIYFVLLLSLTITSVLGTGDIKLLNYLTCTASKRNPKVIPTIRFGSIVKRGYYPWHASIFIKDGPNTLHKCGGSLISKETVLTAAHCLIHRLDKEYKQVSPGSLLVRVDLTDRHGDGISYNVREIKIHKRYNPSIYLHDIALLKLTYQVDFTEFVRPVCITNENFEIFNDNVVGYVSYIC